MRDYIYQGKRYQFADDAVPAGATPVDRPKAEPVKEKAKEPASNKARSGARTKARAR